MATYTFTFLCALSVFIALQVQVPSTSAFFFSWGAPEDLPQSLINLINLQSKPEIVNKHNALRRGVRPSASNMLEMSWNREAAANAQRVANTCTMKHSSDSSREISTSGCGENLYMSSYKNSWSNAIQSWYDEIKDWRYGVGSINGGMVGHFTQVVWYRSNQVGCGVAYCPNSSRKYKYFYVCHYCPPGNYRNQQPYKTGRRCSDCRNSCYNNLCTNPCPYKNRYNNCDSLKRKHSCSNRKVYSWCPASCKCSSQII